MIKNIPKEKVIDVLKQGPTVPAKIVKVVGGDTMLIGAILSTLISTGEVKYSSLKIGGSPLYFLPGHEERLEEFINYLSDKDRKTFFLLKEKKVLKESSQDPLIRVSLKNIKDFAKPFKVNNDLFYRYFSIPLDEAELIAKRVLEEENAKIKVEETTLGPVLEAPPSLKVNELKENRQQLKDIDKEKNAMNIKVKKEKNDFLEKIILKITSLGLDIISKEKIKKTEYAFVLKDHNKNEYIYCVAKDKKLINEGDLSTAIVFSHQKKMPCIFLTTGKITKKVSSMLEKEFKEIRIEYI